MERRGDQARERAELLFFVYHQRGSDRSMTRLHADLQTMGVRVSVATLKRYSARYGWQERIAALDAEAAQQHTQRSVEDLLAMNERHAQLGRAMQGAGGSALQRLLANDSRLAGLKPADIVRLVDLGLKAERRAVGASSDRREIATETWNDVLFSVAPLFTEINQQPDAGIRARLFARRLDRLVEVRLAQVSEEGD